MRLLPNFLCAAAAVVLIAPGAAFAQDARADALVFLNLQTSGTGSATWTQHSEEGAADVFSNVVFADGETTLNVDTLRLTGLRMDGGEPVFETLVFEGILLTQAEPAYDDELGDQDDGKGPDEAGGTDGSTSGPQSMRASRMSFVGPNPIVAAGLARSIFRNEGETLELQELASYGFTEISLEGTAFSFVDDSGEPVDMTIGAVRLEGWGGGTIGRAAIENVSMAGFSMIQGQRSSINFELDTFEIRGLPLAGLQSLVDAAESGEMALGPDSPFMSPFVQAWESYAVRGLAIDVAGIEVGLVELAGETLSTNRGLEYNDHVTALTVSFDPSQPLGAQAMMGLAMIGLDRVEFNITARQVADPSADRIYAEEYRISMTDGFDLDLEYDIGGIAEYVRRTAALQDQMAAGFQEGDGSADAFTDAMAPIIINSVGTVYQDQGLAANLIQLAAGFMGGAAPSQGAPDDDKGPGEGGGEAAGQGGTGSMLAEQIRTNAPPEPGAARDFAMSLADAVETFVNNPNRFILRADPQPPVSISELMALENDPNAAVSRLNMTVSAE